MEKKQKINPKKQRNIGKLTLLVLGSKKRSLYMRFDWQRLGMRKFDKR